MYVCVPNRVCVCVHECAPHFVGNNPASHCVCRAGVGQQFTHTSASGDWDVGDDESADALTSNLMVPNGEARRGQGRVRQHGANPKKQSQTMTHGKYISAPFCPQPINVTI